MFVNKEAWNELANRQAEYTALLERQTQVLEELKCRQAESAEELKRLLEERRKTGEEEAERLRLENTLTSSGDMPVTAGEVRDGYRYLLGREPESREVVDRTLRSGVSFHDYRDSLLNSTEFKRRYSYYGQHVQRSFSQAGEDRVLAYIVGTLRIPFEKCSYLDLGANHAEESSNSCLLYSLGARGVLVEANPQLIPELEEKRKGDVILNRCMSDRDGETVDFYVFNLDGLSTMDPEEVKTIQRENPAAELRAIVKVPSISPNEIMERYFHGEAPFFQSIDLEGMELRVLNAMDFQKYRPFLISIEMIPYEPRLVAGRKDEAIISFMKKNGYFEYAFTGVNSIFMDGTSQYIRGGENDGRNNDGEH